MKAPRRILIAVGILVSGLLGFFLVTAARPDATFLVLGTPTQLKVHSTGYGDLANGLGITGGPPVSNAFVDGNPMLEGKAGTWSSGGVRYDDDGVLRTYSAAFEEGPWHEVDAPLVTRQVNTLLGTRFVEYRIEVQGAVSGNGSQWFFRPQVAGSGPGPDFTIRAELQFEPAMRTLELRLIEKLGNEGPRHYRIEFTVAADGSVTRAD